MKFTKKSILATLLVCVCVFGCFVNSFVNAETTQPLATPAIEEPENAEITPNTDIKNTDINETEFAETIDSIYINIVTGGKIKQYEAMDSKGRYLVRLCIKPEHNDEEYGTENIRNHISSILKDVSDVQYASDEVFKELTNTERGEKVLYFDRNYGHYKYGADNHFDSTIEVGIKVGDMPSFDNLYIKQDLEILYLSEEQYNKIMESGVFYTGNLRLDSTEETYNRIAITYLSRGIDVLTADESFRYIDKMNAESETNKRLPCYYELVGYYNVYHCVTTSMTWVRDYEKDYSENRDYYMQWYKTAVEKFIVE